jgi:predicted CoA-substrate-specific enzyme activase
METFLGIDCGSVSLNLVILSPTSPAPVSIYRRTWGRPLQALVEALDDLRARAGDVELASALVTGSGRELISEALGIPAVNEITAHATGIYRVNPAVRTVIEIGGQDSKFIRIEPPSAREVPGVPLFRMNEICAAGTGAFLDEQAERLGIGIESFGEQALQSTKPAPIAGRCAVFAKTDMIHQAQEGTPVPDILLGLAFALARNYVATLVRGEPFVPLVSLQGGVMSNQAVVHAFRQILGLKQDEIILPPHYSVLGAVGCAVLARREEHARGLTLLHARQMAEKALLSPRRRSWLPPLDSSLKQEAPRLNLATTWDHPLTMGLDIGSVSVKGVVIDRHGNILRSDYRLSHSRPLEGLQDVMASLTSDGLQVSAVAVTGSGRHLSGRLLEADLIVNEITAQAVSAVKYDPEVDTVVEIGGQDSKWIALEHGELKDFEMNRICAAGTGSFLMAQAERLKLAMGKGFSDAAFVADKPADLGSRCTVFMESDLIHHQNNGASSNDLAAGVCLSVVQNYLERVANNKLLGQRVLFLGGVAATPAIRAAFEAHTGRPFRIPPFHQVSGAYGAALKVLAAVERGDIHAKPRSPITIDLKEIRGEEFVCKGCTNRCRVHRYAVEDRLIFNGGLCDRWDAEELVRRETRDENPFALRTHLLEQLIAEDPDPSQSWGMVRSPQFYEWFPFWRGFCDSLGKTLTVARAADRRQFERGFKFLSAETCLPVKLVAGQISELVEADVRTLFHPSILSEEPVGTDNRPRFYCPYIQALSQFFRGAFDVQWIEPFISYELDPAAFKREPIRFAQSLGFSRKRGAEAVAAGLESLAAFKAGLEEQGQRFLDDLGANERALIVLGKPYHTADSFLNMNLGSLVARLGIKALPADMLPADAMSPHRSVSWKYQREVLRAAQVVGKDPRLFPVFVTFFGCGPDPFTLRHIREAISGKPLLILEMDEHSSRAGVITRLEAFLDSMPRAAGVSLAARRRPLLAVTPAYTGVAESPDEGEKSAFEAEAPARDTSFQGTAEASTVRRKPHVLYLPYLADHTYGFAAAARSVDIETVVLPPPDEESEQLGRPHMVGGECHPYALLLGDYLKVARGLSPEVAADSLFYILGPDACRLSQFPVYIDKVRNKLGLGLGVISEIDEALEAFGLSQRHRRHLLLRAWEGLNAYDVLMELFLQIRPYVSDTVAIDEVYVKCRDLVCDALADGKVRVGMEEVFQILEELRPEIREPRPLVAVTGDYYTRVVSYANNDVYREIEALGGVLLPPPTFSDCFKMSTLRDLTWGFESGRGTDVLRRGLLFGFMAMSEYKVRGAGSFRDKLNVPRDLSGWALWKSAADYADHRLPSGITAPIATALQQADAGADGILNLMTLNCSYGTVVTAALLRALRQRPGLPMLTLVYDGLKKTNEKTRLEAFMEQVHARFRARMSRGSVGSHLGHRTSWGLASSP